MPNYDAIRLYHRVDAILLDGETHRRLSEVRNPPYPNEPLCKALARAVGRKSDTMNNTECAILREFPEQGLDLGFYARALIFAPAFNYMPRKKHCAIVSLIRLGRLGICEGIRDGQRVQILAKL